MFETYAEEEDCLGMEGLCGLCEAVGKSRDRREVALLLLAGGRQKTVHDSYGRSGTRACAACD